MCWPQHLTDGADGEEAAGLTEGLKQGSNTCISQSAASLLFLRSMEPRVKAREASSCPSATIVIWAGY